MKIAVFGGTGRTGIHVVARALAEGHEVDDGLIGQAPVLSDK